MGDHEKAVEMAKQAFDGKLTVLLRYDLTDTAGVLENKVLSMFHGLDD